MKEFELTDDQRRKQKIEWAEDYMTHAKTGNPMREWEYFEYRQWCRLQNDYDACILDYLDDSFCRKKDDKK